MGVIFICVSHNSSSETIEFITNVLYLKGAVSKTVIVDNSTNPVERKILTDFVARLQNKESVYIIECENKGYFSGLNEGILYTRHSLAAEGYFVVGNNDLIFENNFLIELQKLNDENGSILVFAPDVVTQKGSHENPHVEKRIGGCRKLKYDIYYSNYLLATIANFIFKPQRPNKKKIQKRTEIYMGIGASYILTPAFFKHFDKLWDKLFLYGEEAVLAAQVASVGGKMVYEPSLVCYHKESSSTKKMSFRERYHISRKSYKIYRKYL